MEVFYEELQGLVVSRRQLPQQVLDLEEDPVELHADLGRARRRGAEPLGLHLLRDNALALLGQADEVVVVAEEDERLRELRRKSVDTKGRRGKQIEVEGS